MEPMTGDEMRAWLLLIFAAVVMMNGEGVVWAVFGVFLALGGAVNMGRHIWTDLKRDGWFGSR